MSNSIMYVQTQRYVYFDDNGNLLSVSNTDTQPGNRIAVELNEIDSLLSGKEQFFHYQVIFDTVKKSYILKHVFNNEEINLDINVDIYKISKQLDSLADLKITQDIKNKTWHFSLDKTVRENFRTKNMHLNSILTFSITQYNDLHQLEKFIKIRISDLVENETIGISFDTQIELDPSALSVYTTKRLETYYHEVLV